MEYVRELDNKLLRYGPEVVAAMRKEFNLEKLERREEAVSIIQQWLKTQDHLIKKDYSKAYIERCLFTTKGSIERVKVQIDKLCTLRTLMPKYFNITNVKESDIVKIMEKGYFGIVPVLTKEYYRTIIIKVKPNSEINSYDHTLHLQLYVIVAEFLKSNDCTRGFILVADMFDSTAAEVISAINLVELQQFIPIMTEGYGTKIKGIIFVTASKFIEGFVKLLKPLFSEKIASRIHVATSREAVQEFINMKEDSLPEEYGGKGDSVEVLHKNLFEYLCSKTHQELLKEMNAACTDESKRRTDKYNDQYMGMPGTFRTLSLD